MDRRGIYETEFWGAVMWIVLIVFVVAEAAWLRAWTSAWAMGLAVLACVGWLCLVQYGAAKKRSRERRKEAVRAKILALNPQERSHLSELASRGEICLSGDDAEDQIDAALRRF
jgi:cobalamin biosynthesis protein CobD/CbiB